MPEQNSSTGVSLQELLQGLTQPLPGPKLRITGLGLDSRSIRPGEAFLAVKGSSDDGSRYARDAVARGAAVILLEEGLDCPDDLNVPVIPVRNLRARAGLIAARFHGEPSTRLNVVGITGTNGKTSVSHFVAQVLNEERHGRVGCIGTLGYGIYPELDPALNTTPDAVTLQRLLAGFADAHADCVVMEVSSHALEQGRVKGVGFDIAVFTNLSHEHLDFHVDMNGYYGAKRKLFLAPGLATAVINADDDFGRSLMEELAGRVRVLGYGVAENGSSNPISARLLRRDAGGLELDIHSPWGAGRLSSTLIGRFNAGNLLAALAVLCLLDMPFERAIEGLTRVRPVPGRMEAFGDPDGPAVIVDYAHTPDALEQVLLTLKGLCKGRLVCVFGCGGDRDSAKRPQMGRVAEQYADRIILTSDNPRGENPQAIIDDIAAGIETGADTMIDEDRAGAITIAIRTARPDDIVLIAGKGHETYQEIAGRRYPFSDRQLVRNLLEKDS